MIIKNPIVSDIVGAIRDPMILPDNGKYYLVGTSQEFWTGYNPGVRLWVSDNLFDWSFVKTIISRDEFAEDKPYRDRFWAPELFKYKNKYYCLFNAHNESMNPLDKGLRSFVAVADNIKGPYTVMEKPLIDENFTTNDAHLFADDDGKVYLFYTLGYEIRMNEFYPETCTVSREYVKVIEKGEKDDWDSVGIEGSFVIKRNGIYYHWYSSWTRSYEMGLAVTDSLKKPFVKCEINPVISGFNKDTKISYCGHNACFTHENGKDYVVFHAAGDGFLESLCINDIEYPVLEAKCPDEVVEI